MQMPLADEYTNIPCMNLSSIEGAEISNDWISDSLPKSRENEEPLSRSLGEQNTLSLIVSYWEYPYN